MNTKQREIIFLVFLGFGFVGANLLLNTIPTILGLTGLIVESKNPFNPVQTKARGINV
jgi:hypothetical protein